MFLKTISVLMSKKKSNYLITSTQLSIYIYYDHEQCLQVQTELQCRQKYSKCMKMSPSEAIV
jgi:hypothetical protein